MQQTFVCLACALLSVTKQVNATAPWVSEIPAGADLK